MDVLDGSASQVQLVVWDRNIVHTQSQMIPSYTPFIL